MKGEILLSASEELSAEDVAVVEDVLNYYLACSAELKAIMRKNGSEELGCMAGKGFLTRKLLGPSCKAIIIETATGLYASDPEDYGVGWDMRRHQAFSSTQLQIISGIIDAQSKVLVVGAHIGTLAIPISRMCGQVTAIEANPRTFRLLEMNLRLNNVSNCEILNIAANDKEEQLHFLLSKANSGGSKRVPLIDQYNYRYDEPDEIELPAFPLDSFLTRRDFDLVLMDIEGSEYFALKGMQEILRHTQTLILEFMPHHLLNVSGVTVEELLQQLTAFNTLTVHSLNKTVDKDGFAPLLNYMYDNQLEDEGLIFSK